LEPGNVGEVPLVWNGSTPTVLGIVSGYKTGRATGINNNGLIVGEICCDDLFPEAVVWRGNAPTLLPRLQTSQSGGAAAGGDAVAVNGSGIIVGEASTTGNLVYAVAWSNGVVTNLGWVGAGTSAAPTSVNNQGIIVGKSTIEGPAIEHAALWSRIGAAPQDLNALISATQAAEFELIDATGINDSCTIAANGRIRKTGAYVALLLTLIDPSNCVNGL
jgi:chitinase